ncbi:TetR/AcrR family transcriptional regulator [Lactobacillus psittaci]|uniref:HTH tetR-type domain-containing protein n=1 Tax=Lactobacillus psittaci DSM 15354 TaxID=1122152 RepID=A0A0R1RZZ9_9LACO|nr:DUF1492 domain-containing protein [Lactobacillus psittaci]KRL61902.1 hypothetical protein FC23_GL000451 [Lactobacillus psittaci DSM 15354]
MENRIERALSSYYIKKITVTQICQELEISRVAFYYRYRTREKFLADLVVKQLNKFLLSSKYGDLTRRVHVLIEAISENPIFWDNVARTIMHEPEAGRIIERGIYMALKIYAENRGPYSNSTLKRVAMNLHHTGFFWAHHGFREHPHVLFHVVEPLVKEIEQQAELIDHIEYPCLRDKT